MELIGHDEFLNVSAEGLDSIEDRLGTFPVTNRGIQIWLPLRPYCGSRSLFEARLPCRDGPWDPPVTIDLILWESNYYRCRIPHYLELFSPEGRPQLRQVYLRYQDPPHRNTTFEIDDSALTQNGCTCCDAYPKNFTGNTLTLTSTDSFYIKVYSDNLTNTRLVVGLGQSFGEDWIRVLSDESNLPLSWGDYDVHESIGTKLRMLQHAQHMNKVRSGAEQVCIMEARLPRTTRVLQISSVMWKTSRMCGVKLEVFHHSGFGDISSERTAFDVQVGSFFAGLITDTTIYLGNRRSRL